MQSRVVRAIFAQAIFAQSRLVSVIFAQSRVVRAIFAQSRVARATCDNSCSQHKDSVCYKDSHFCTEPPSHNSSSQHEVWSCCIDRNPANSPSCCKGSNVGAQPVLVIAKTSSWACELWAHIQSPLARQLFVPTLLFVKTKGSWAQAALSL